MSFSPVHRLAAFGVHLFTASGAIFALLALRAIALDEYPLVFFWMGAALVVDSVDGTMARAAKVKEVYPNLDGALMDNIVDYLNYVIVPAYLLIETDLLAVALPRALVLDSLPGLFSLFGASLIVLSSAYQFCRTDAKTADNYFTGFPSYWNVAVFYLYVIDLAPALNFAVLVVLSALVFIPVRYIYPSRTAAFFKSTLVLTALWMAAIIAIASLYPAAPDWLVMGSLVYVLYYFGLSVFLTLRRRQTEAV
ncbi:MAG: CDP-diacylglycerol O-phosphatidyltransferase [bacterium]|nr:CDP-diacylglycerol O-phosphatidyltransferase [bacterium]